MLKHPWYPATGGSANGTIVLIGGFTAGGYINRKLPHIDPIYKNGQAESTKISLRQRKPPKIWRS
jgi:hypothetical protein